MRYFLSVLLLFLFIAVTNAQVSNSDMTKRADTSRKLTIRKIIIEGNKVTRSSVILREIDINEGDIIPSDSIDVKVSENKQRLFNLQLFNEVDQHTERSGDQVDWYINVKERWYILPSFTVQFADRNLNTWWVKEDHDLRRAMVGLTVTDKNFRGNLETLAVTVQEGYTQKVGINYMRPYVDRDQVHGIGFSLSYALSRQTYFATDSNKLVYAGNYAGPVILRQFEGGISYIYRPAYASKHTFQLNYKDYGVSDTIIKLNRDYYTDSSNKARFLEFFYRYEYNGVDNWNYSLSGFKLLTQMAVRSGFEGLKFQSYVNIEAGFFRNFLPKWYYSTVFRGRLMYLQDHPYFFQGGLGTQTDYVRGYEYYIIDGSNYGLVRLDLKRELFSKTYFFGLKYFTAVPLRIYPKIFFDAGYINTPASVLGNSFLSNRFLYSIGIGLDVVTLYDIKIRFEFAYNHLAQNGLYLHFNSE